MSAANFLIDTSALVPIMKQDPRFFAWQRAAAAGLIAVCPIVELEFFFSARSASDREAAVADMRTLFGWEPVDDRAYHRAWEVQGELTKRGQHRSAGPVDLVLAATAELRGLTLLHRDHDFDCIAAVTGQPHQWLGPGDNPEPGTIGR
ncbi:PIN domain nuclease [Nocardia sp. NPDC050710]|uniref:PIN domain nuclease n=1 Tax=Nocardia sp. NPDC050710 TaxID=3157220 RepID=UPI0033F0C08E